MTDPPSTNTRSSTRRKNRSQPKTVIMADPPATNTRSTRRKNSIPSLVQLSHDACMKDLKNSLTGIQASASYCCGGHIKLYTCPDGIKKHFGPDSALVLRWDDPRDKSTARVIRFPLSGKLPYDVETLPSINTLIDAYEHNGTVDEKDFSINFDPARHLILDAVAQILLPQTDTNHLKSREAHRGVRVRACRLHICSERTPQHHAPPTPNSPTYLGRLLVFLPYPYKGGELAISSKGDETPFDFDMTKRGNVHWAAFTRNSSYRVQPVTEGCQLFLSYDLFVNERVGRVSYDSDLARPRFFPLWKGLKSLLDKPQFFRKGAKLGYWCQHNYDHTNITAHRRLPHELRGVDLTVYKAFDSLGCDVDVKPVLDPDDCETFERWEHNFIRHRFDEGFLGPKKLWLDEFRDGGDAHDSDGDSEEFPKLREWQRRRNVSYVGQNFTEVTYIHVEDFNMREGNDRRERLLKNWPHDEVTNITWLNEPKSKGEGWESDTEDLAVLCRYADYSYLQRWERYHSQPVILITIQPAEDR